MSTSEKREKVPDDPKVYIVFTYEPGFTGISKRIQGIYLAPEEAVKRQKDLIPNGKFDLNGSRCGKCKKGWNLCSFVNVFPLGDGDTEVHTTYISDWKYYA